MPAWGRITTRAALAVLTALPTTGEAHAAPQWFAHQPAFQFGTGLSGTMAADGTVAFVGISNGSRIEVRARPPGGVLTAPVSFDYQGALNFGHAVSGTDGTVAAVWRAGGTAYASVRQPGGDFGPVRERETGVLSEEQIALDADGGLWAVWETPDQQALLVARLDEPDAPPRIVSTQSSDERVRNPVIAADREGTSELVYLHEDHSAGPGGECTLATQVRAVRIGRAGVSMPDVLEGALAHGTYDGRSCDLSAAESGSSLEAARLARHPSGAAIAIYDEIQYPVRLRQGLARYRTTGGQWPSASTPAERIATGDWLKRVAFAGDIPLVMLGAVPALALTSRDVSGQWHKPITVSDNAKNPRLAGSLTGSALIAFLEASGPYRVVAVVRSPGAQLSEPTPLSGYAFSDPHAAAMDEQGNAMVAFNVRFPHSSSNYPAFAAYDGAGPQLREQVPATGYRGQEVGFAASPVDVWSDVASGPSWLFGDGSTAAGHSVKHLYLAEGAYTATISATDSLGNTSTAQRNLTIGTAPPPIVPPSSIAPPPPRTYVLPDRIAPRFTRRPRVRPARLSRGKKGRITFALSEAATVRVTLTRLVAGVRRQSACVAPPSGNRGRRRGCTRRLRAGSFAARAATGQVTLRFPAKLRGRRLKRGRYVATLVATDAAGNRSRAASARFSVR